MKHCFCSVVLQLVCLAASAIAGAQTPQAYKGWPGHDDISDLQGCFVNPPKGYGNVPFYWWTGDPLDMDRLTEQLEILADSATDGLNVSYNHTLAAVDVEMNAQGHGPCGRVSPGEPRVMTSDAWWDIWNKFSAKCAEKGIGLGMDDYVLAWPKNGEHMDSVLLDPAVRQYQGKLVMVKSPKGATAPENCLLKLKEEKDSTLYICTEPDPWLYPELGNTLIDKYFRKFIDHLDEDGIKGMNYFFQDELQYGLGITSWCEDMPEQFLARKGYDIVPYLDRMFITDPDAVDAQTARIRLDYAEVLTQLAEERFFKPVFDWNASKGLIYGCDNEGRGLRPTMYMDYFRAVSWFTAPGNDAPSRGSSFRQTKVSSSIAHLYGRPRTWLEAFHSIGWDANGALLKRQLDHHIIAGGNLLCMHGLYYSTHGGWWEWAPPCFHFRMPYWEHMKIWLKYAERMCFLLSQGNHVCDIAILYPTETMQAVPGTNAESTFKVSDELSAHGLDYDFIDYQSLQKSSVEDAALKVAGESYKVLVLADTRFVHGETLEKILSFMRAGGIVLATGYVMPELQEEGVRTVEDAAAFPEVVRGLIHGDFCSEKGDGRVLHRRIGDKDIYMVMDVDAGELMYFRALGKAECWDAMDGSVRPLGVVRTDSEGSWVRFDGEDDAAMLVVFSPGGPVMESDLESKVEGPASEQRITGDWDIEIVPTMNNKWGDFRLEDKGSVIGVEAREMRYFAGADAAKPENVPCDFYGYGPYMETCNLDASEDLEAFLSSDMLSAEWEPYVWSWQYGVKDNPGSQGYHGLKAKVDSRFLILDKGCHQIFRTNVYAPGKRKYRIIVEGVEPARLLVDGKDASAGEIKLRKGWHKVVAAYADTRKEEYSLEKKRGEFIDTRDRSMVVFYPVSSPDPEVVGMYEDYVGSRWYRTDHLVYDINPAPTEWHMQFETAPGTNHISFQYKGSVKEVLVDGKPAVFNVAGDECQIRIEGTNPGVSIVSVTAVPDRGYPGPAFFTSPAKLSCSGGRMPEGDWTAEGALGFYSGGIRYGKDMDINVSGSPIVLDLGEVDATCEVSVNGQFVKALISSPYKLDISDYVHEGTNRVEVLVYSSLANHYRTTPSPYRGQPHAGLIGPVRVLYH